MPHKIKDLNTLRYNSFVKATAKNSCVKLPSSAPTADAAFGHFKRVYLEIQTWFEREILPEVWGWKYESEILTPETMTQLPAPHTLLSILWVQEKWIELHCSLLRMQWQQLYQSITYHPNY